MGRKFANKPESTVLSDADKRAMRLELRDNLAVAMADLETAAGWRELLISRAIHGETLTASNLALAARFCPGRLLTRYQDSPRQIPADRSADLRLIGRSFWPVANWAWSPGIVLPAPDLESCETLAGEWRARSGKDRKGAAFRALIESRGPELDRITGPIVAAPVDSEPEPAGEIETVTSSSGLADPGEGLPF